MGGYAGRNEHQKSLSKLYGQLCYRFSRHEVWQDAMWMFACAISNSVDRRYADDREKQYLRIVQKYNKKEQQLFPQLFGEIVNGMERYPDCDFLGELYMELELGNKHGGQFFTPYHLCRAMAKLELTRDLLDSEMARQGYVSINDCACGAGALLVAAANGMKALDFDYQRNALFVAQDIDSTTALMCYIQLSLLGCAGYVVIGDTLRYPQTGDVLFGENTSRCWYTPMFFREAWALRRSVQQARTMFGAVAGRSENRPAFTAWRDASTGRFVFNFDSRR
ncbi:MAG: SAM-dependent DNA methyltransferase [Clostridia bacterium]|nr:SAM-dependent DNA methyltransferase [Clostridia bacterium]